MTFWKWSQTASANGTADSTCPFPEGMAPSAVNDGVRGAMAALAKYRDDIGGLIATAGSSTAYTYSSYQGFDSFAHMNGAMIAFAPHAKPLRSAPGIELVAATIIQGTPYAATYNNTSGEWILHGLFGNPYNIPLLGGMDYWGFTAPNSAFVFPAGQAISRMAYASAFAIISTTFGAGDGSTTFNVPDLRGRVAAAADNMGGTGAGRLPFGFSGTGGASSQTLAAANLPASPVSISGSTSGYTPLVGGGGAQAVVPGSAPTAFNASGANQTYQVNNFGTVSGFSSLSVTGTTSNLGSSTPVTTLPPTIACNYIMRII
jgi:microcystin-dependent protein